MCWAHHGATKATKTAVFVGAVILPVALLLAFIILFFDPNVVSTADIHTERVSFDVVDPRKAAFYLAGVKIGPLGGGEPGACVSGLFTPARGTGVTYGRVGKGPLEITLAPYATSPGVDPASVPVGSFEPGNGMAAIAYRGTTGIVTDERCKPPASQRLPIWGYLRIGQEFRPASDRDAPEPSFLLSGKLEVAAHAIGTGALYQVTTVTVPVGARLQTDVPKQGQRAPEQAIWWGAATTDPDHVALDVVAATEAPRLALYRPNQTEADVIKLSALAQLTTDPTIVRASFLFGVALFFLSGCAFFAGLWQEHEERKERHAQPPRG